MAFASTVVDVTVEMIAQIAFIIIGLILLTVHLPGAATRVPMVETAIIGILVAVLAAGAFFIVQRRGFSFLETHRRALPAGSRGPRRGGGPGHQRDPCRAGSHGGGLRDPFPGLAFERLRHLAGAGADRHTASASPTPSPSRALLCAARSAAVFVPGAIGIQEAGYAVMMPLFGLPPDIGIAVSLLKRAREIAVGAPVLLSWQIAEGGYAARPRAAKPAGDRAAA